MAAQRRNGGNKVIWAVSALVAVCLVGTGIWVVKLLVSDTGGQRKRQVQMVTLVKPPPPPKVKEEPPPPPEEKEEIPEPEPEEVPPEEAQDEGPDEGPADDDLGLDAEGGAGSDGFGLKAKKGGRALIGSNLGGGSLLHKYAWYTRILQEEIKKKFRKHLEENGGIPRGKSKAVVKILIAEDGSISRYKLIQSSGDEGMDHALEAAVRVAQIDEPPPDGMPRAVKLLIDTQG